MIKTNKINGGPGCREAWEAGQRKREGWILNIFLSGVRDSGKNKYEKLLFKVLRGTSDANISSASGASLNSKVSAWR